MNALAKLRQDVPTFVPVHKHAFKLFQPVVFGTTMVRGVFDGGSTEHPLTFMKGCECGSEIELNLLQCCPRCLSKMHRRDDAESFSTYWPERNPHYSVILYECTGTCGFIAALMHRN